MLEAAQSHPSSESLPGENGDQSPLDNNEAIVVKDAASVETPITGNNKDDEQDSSSSHKSPTSPPPLATTKTIIASDEADQPLLSRKRSNPEDAGSPDASSMAKKRKLNQVEAPMQSQTPRATPEPEEQAIVATQDLFNDASQQLLRRSCALVLRHVGFDTAKEEALEAFVYEVDTYMLKLFSYVTESMRASRRTQPTAQDFEFAMRGMGLTSRHLTPHLAPPLDLSILQFEYPLPEEIAPLPETPAILLGSELSGISDKQAKNYIPASFPAFPSKHTYKSTISIPERERDARKIREQATAASRNAEEALRRLVKVSKVGGQSTKRGLEHNERKRIRNDLWEKTMADFAIDEPSSIEEQSISVDAGKQFWRSDASKRRA